MKVAIVHDWLNGMRGGEKVLEALLELWPDAPIFTLFHERGKVSRAIESHPIVTSSLDRIPGIYTHYRNLLPLYPAAITSLDVGTVDLVISSSHSAAKGIRTGSARHICYCHTPMRYAWDAVGDYATDIPKRIGLAAFGPRLRRWDKATAQHVDDFIANSNFVAARIQSCYGRHATLIPPPVDTTFFCPPRQPEDFFLSAGALVPYKRVDLAVEAFNRSGHRLIVAGEGPERKRLMRKAHANIEFTGWVSNRELRDLYRRARALIFPGREDFGIVPVEARSCGCPVIAFSDGGVGELLKDGINSILFEEQSIPDLQAAIDRFETLEWLEGSVRQGTSRFSRESFKSRIKNFVESR